MNKRTQHAAQILSFVLAAASQAATFRAQAETQATCSIVSPADIEKALGEPVGHPQSEEMGAASTCRFLSTGKPAKYISVMVIHHRDDLSSTKISERLKQMLAPNARPVTGVGDDAAWGTTVVPGKVINQMMVRIGKFTTITILVNGLPDNEDTVDRVRTLAAKIVPKV